MVGLYFLIGLLLMGFVIYWQDEFWISGETLFVACLSTFFAWPITAVVLGASYLRRLKKRK